MCCVWDHSTENPRCPAARISTPVTVRQPACRGCGPRTSVQVMGTRQSRIASANSIDSASGHSARNASGSLNTFVIQNSVVVSNTKTCKTTAKALTGLPPTATIQMACYTLPRSRERRGAFVCRLSQTPGAALTALPRPLPEGAGCLAIRVSLVHHLLLLEQ